ncbi:DNA-binding protein [Phakopsora pachyrhizi]|uniref:DNA-binding protein n=1 Tax=Phakopsora pachyrhizi TaxID=170000 RepID=A0AAV0ARP1_PHAPC|nr:DNA-binding protein [Phakopsora pachyrhizi]
MPLAKPIRRISNRTTSNNKDSSVSIRTRTRTRTRTNLTSSSRAINRTIRISCDRFRSTAIVCEFIYYCFNTILSVRKLYDDYQFRFEKRYEIYLPLLIDDSLKIYLKSFTTQLKPWLEDGRVSRIVLVIISKETRETVERWQFEIRPSSSSSSSSSSDESSSDLNTKLKESDRIRTKVLVRSDREMQAEVLQILRQIFSSVTFMPILQPDQYLFKILSYVDKGLDVPDGWMVSDAHLISANSEQVPIHGLTTSVHSLTSTVTYINP